MSIVAAVVVVVNALVMSLSVMSAGMDVSVMHMGVLKSRLGWQVLFILFKYDAFTATTLWI